MMAIPPPVTLGCYWVNDYEKPPTCGFFEGLRVLEQTKHCDDLADGFAGAMRRRGHRLAVRRIEGAASPLQWELATDADSNGVDTVDFAFLATHGGTRGRERSGGGWVHWVNATFNSRDGCRVSTIESPVDLSDPKAAMQLGDGSLRWVVLDLCRSLQIGLVNEELRPEDEDRRKVLTEAHPARTWRRCFSGVHIIFGFTGASSDASWTATRGAAFGRRAAAGERLAESWLDEAHSSVKGDAPVAVAWGLSEEDALRRLKAESLASPESTLDPTEIRGCAVIWRS